MKLICCPRCHRNWELKNYSIDGESFTDFYCFKCELRFIFHEQRLALRNPIKQDYNLVWYLDQNYCAYGSLEEAVRDKTLKLPWLPFDISKERLQLIILFS